MPRWYEAVQQVTETTANPTGVGSRYDIVRSLPNGPAFNDVEVVEYTQNHQVTIESRSGPTPFRYRYRVEPSQEDTTLTLDGNITSAGLPGPAGHLGGIATQLFKHGMQQNLHRLKQILEARTTTQHDSPGEDRMLSKPNARTERAHRTTPPSEQRGRT